MRLEFHGWLEDDEERGEKGKEETGRKSALHNDVITPQVACRLDQAASPRRLIIVEVAAAENIAVYVLARIIGDAAVCEALRDRTYAGTKTNKGPLGFFTIGLSNNARQRGMSASHSEAFEST